MKLFPEFALALFRVTGEGGDGVRTAIRIGRHAVLVDEPPDPGGEDAVPNPVEAALAGLLSCQVVTYRRLHVTVVEHCRLAAIARDDRGEADVRGDPTPPTSAS